MTLMNSNKWLRNLTQTTASDETLVCFPHAGGNASFYKGLATHLSSRLQVLAIQYPGHETRLNEPFITNLELLIEQITDVLAQLDQQHFMLFGHSMGAIVAYEVAIRLDKTKKINQLFLSAQPAPHKQRKTRLLQTEEELWQELIRLSSNTSSLLDRSVFKDIFFPALQNDYRLIYEYKNYCPMITSIPITALIAEDDPETTLEEVIAWQELTSGSFSIHSFKGNHFYLIDHLLEIVALSKQRVI